MFTAEGELKEEYRFLEKEGPGKEGEAPPKPEREPAPPPPASPPSEAQEPAAPVELPRSGPGLSFIDLVAMLAEPVPIFLGDAPMADGSMQEDLEMARLHIDMLDVLRRKTVGNLSAQESRLLEDALYQLRMRFVQKQG